MTANSILPTQAPKARTPDSETATRHRHSGDRRAWHSGGLEVALAALSRASDELTFDIDIGSLNLGELEDFLIFSGRGGG